MHYHLGRSERKTLSVKIDETGRIVVMAPKRLSRKYIEDFLARHAKMLQQRSVDAVRAYAAKTDFYLDYGSEVSVFGQIKRLVSAEEVSPEELAIKESEPFAGEYSLIIPANLSRAEIKCLIKKFYRHTALNSMTSRVRRYEPVLGVKASAVKINNARMRWGSCSSAGSINFSWRAAMASPKTQDYLAIHELAHLIHLNHSPAFWAEINRFFPDHAEAKKELDALQKKLRFQNWEDENL